MNTCEKNDRRFDSRFSAVRTSKSPRQQFSNWTLQDVCFCHLSTENRVSFHSQQKHFVVVTFHSADVTNPSPVPQEPGISFATFGIQKRASLSLNPLQIISLFFSFFCTPFPFFSPPSFPAFDSFHRVHYTPRPWSRKIDVQPRLAPDTAYNLPPLSALRLGVWFAKHIAPLIWRCGRAHQVSGMWAVCALVSDCGCPGSKIIKKIAFSYKHSWHRNGRETTKWSYLAANCGS